MATTGQPAAITGRKALTRWSRQGIFSHVTEPPPFFVTGFQRSGTTLLRLMLDNHPDVAIPLDAPELWERYQGKVATYGDLGVEANARALVQDLLAEERIQLWKTPLDVDGVLRFRRLPGYPGIIDAFYRAYAFAHGKSRWGDKDPGNVLRIATLNRWFPDCQVVHIIRDGRAACLSHQTVDFGLGHLMDCANAWREQVTWVRRMGELLGPARYFELRYEDLVAEPQPLLRRLCDFLGLDFQPAMLEYHRNVEASIPAEKRHIWPKIGEPPRADNATRWKTQLSHGAQVCFEKRAGETLHELGYETTPPPWSGAYFTELGFLLQMVMATVRQRLAPGTAAR